MPDIQILSGLALIEIGGGVATRYCGRLFAQMGATVVRVAGGDIVRSRTGFDFWLDADKHAAAGFEAACALVADRAQSLDAVVVGQTSAEVDAGRRLVDGCKERPLLVGATWFDAHGPYANWAANEPVIDSLSGLPYSFGPRDGPPTLMQGYEGQILAGTNLFAGTAAALVARRQGCESPAEVSTAIHEALLCFAEVMIPDLLAAGATATRPGVNLGATCEPAGIFRARDGWVGICALTPQQWEGFCTLVGRPDLMENPLFSSFGGRLKNKEALWAEINPLLAKRDSADLALAGQELRVPVTQVPDHAELLASPHWQARDSFRPLSIDAGTARAPGLPFRISHASGKPAACKAPRACGGAGPLQGIRVVDFTMGWAGPLATRTLADLGAEVVKIESPYYPDWLRGGNPADGSNPPSHELNRMYNVLNRNKLGISVDLRTRDGSAAVHRLIASADLVIDNFASGVMARMGFGPEALLAAHPELVVIAMSAFGAAGPWNHFRAYGMTAEQASGLPYVNGCAEWSPAMQHLATGDPVGGIYGAAIAIAALLGRNSNGGAFYDLSQVECLFQLGAQAFIAREVTGQPVARTGSRRPEVAPCCVVETRTADEWITVTAATLPEWHALCGIIGKPDWANAPLYATPAGRNADADAIEGAIASWALSQDAADAVLQLQNAGVPAAPVIPSHRLASDPQLLETGFWQWADRQYVGRHMMGVAPIRIDLARLAVNKPAPTLGEDNAGFLGS